MTGRLACCRVAQELRRTIAAHNQWGVCLRAAQVTAADLGEEAQDQHPDLAGSHAHGSRKRPFEADAGAWCRLYEMDCAVVRINTWARRMMCHHLRQRRQGFRLMMVG